MFWRILLFYVFAILIISLIIPYTDPSVLRNDVKDISVSPFTLVFQHVVLLSAGGGDERSYSDGGAVSGYSGMYASTVCCTPWRVTVKRRAFAKLSRGGVPRRTRCMRRR